ncbi:SMI1/KNR4 family protein [Actinoplanes sp. NBRC 103695]|uniref:SMI1/KNR4 family protein n=1 Tax=Actinoplanes sp. NBRC 103695 TaxID=3032202 RepID=UPI0024A1FC16|nr:SMI1/KNR4 family protein [Actinoplanes sp. NBRC 103695]GLZ00275.1 hypothetical protein Acsp02_75270 [Actinoplanes sp. NBRC 103695]
MQRTVAGILAALDRIAVHNRDEDEPSRPRGPASVESIDRVQEALGKVLPSAYVEFLRLHDGWPGFPWGVNLFGTDELTGAAYVDAWDTLEICNEVDDGVPAELMNATIIANSYNEPELVLLLDSGEVVEFLYAEYERHADLAAYFAVERERVEAHLAAVLATQAEVEADWDAEHRAAKEAQLLQELRVLPDRSRAGAPCSPAPTALDPAPAIVTATELAVRD